MMAADRTPVSTIEQDQVVVEKTLSVTEPNVAKVEFHLDSQADVDLRVALEDPRPPEWPSDRIGFHPDHEPEMWTIEDEAITYVQKIEAGGEHESLYAVQFEDETELGAFERDPSIEVEAFPQLSQPSPSIEDGPGVLNGDETFGAATATEEPAAPPLYRGSQAEEDDQGDDDPFDTSTDDGPAAEFPEPPDIDQPVDTATSNPEPEAGDEADRVPELNQETQDDVDEREFEASVADTDSPDILEAFLDEFENASEERRQAIADALEVKPRTSVQTRIENLEQEITELTAYTGALEEFLDDEGDAQQILDTVHADQNELADRVDSLSEETEHLRGQIKDLTEVEERLDEIESTVDDIPMGLPGKIEALYDELEHLESQHGERIETLERRLSEELGELDQQISRDIDQLRTDVADYREATDERIDDRLDEFEEQIRPELESIKDECLETLEEVESSRASTQDEIERIAEELEDLAAWQSTMQDTFANLSGTGMDE